MALIVPATLADIDVLAAIEERLFTSDRISRRQFRYLLSKGNSWLLKAVVDDTLAGYILLLKRRASNASRIYSIAVVPDFQGRGLATALISHAGRLAASHGLTRLTLEVNENNLAACNLYRSLGFVEFGRKPDYYEDGSTAIRMVQRLAPVT